MRRWGTSAYHCKNFLLVLLCILLWNCESKPQPVSKGAARQTTDDVGQTGQLTKLETANPIVDEFLSLVDAIGRRRPALEREKDRRGKLMLELMANIGAGCMHDVRVNNLEIKIDGDKLDDLDVTHDKANAQFLPEPEQGKTMFEFSFGDISETNVISIPNNEYQKQMFNIASSLTYSVPADKNFKIGNIDFIRIKKRIPVYRKLDIGGVPKVEEVERYMLNNLTIKVNGLVLYSQDGINHGFSLNPGGPEDARSEGLTWKENNAQLNQAFAALLQRDECQ
ncbi:MAG: hypothetical protein HYW48_07935 [Deltaproteobacteria bacterium]|nr:hypothetical protein [Deltaproteobacteria bacterium]